MPGLSRIGFPRQLRKNLKQSDQEFMRAIKSKMKDAIEFRQGNREKHWKDNEKRYMGDQWPSTGDDVTADRIVVNKTFSTIGNIVPFITEGDVEFIVEPYSGTATSASAKLTGIWLNRYWRTNEFDGTRHNAKAAWDSLIYGDGFGLPAYDIKDIPVRGPAGKALALSTKSSAQFVFENVSPWDVWIDRYATGLWDARWYIRRFTLPEEVAKEDKRFSFRDEIGTMDSTEYFEDGRMFRTNVREGEGQMAILYEYWDRDREVLVVFSDQSEFPHMWLDYVARNLVQLPNHPIPNMPYHMSEIEQMTDLQDELNKTRSQMITHRRRNVPKLAYDKQMFDAAAIDALQSSIIMQGIPADTASGPLSEGVYLISPIPVPEDVYNVAQIISNDIDEITGVNEYLRGVLSEVRRTATEASIIEGSSNTKIRHKLSSVERFTREIGQAILEIASEVIPTTEARELEMYLTGEEAMAALNAGGQDVYDETGTMNDALLTPTPQLFAGKYEVFVQQGSTELRNPEAKEMKMHKLFTTLSASYQLLSMAGVIVDLSKALRLWLDTLGIVDVNSIINSPQAIAAFEQAQIAAAAGMQQQGEGGAPGAGGEGQDQVGVPNEAGAQPPEANPAPDSSGMLPPQAMDSAQ